MDVRKSRRSTQTSVWRSVNSSSFVSPSPPSSSPAFTSFTSPWRPRSAVSSSSVPPHAVFWPVLSSQAPCLLLSPGLLPSFLLFSCYLPSSSLISHPVLLPFFSRPFCSHLVWSFSLHVSAPTKLAVHSHTETMDTWTDVCDCDPRSSGASEEHLSWNEKELL